MKKYLLLFFFVSAILFLLGYLPQYFRETKPYAETTKSIWLHGWYAPDFSVYLSAITLGQNGYLLFRNPFTSEVFPPLPYYLYYIALGWLTGFLELWPPYVYHIAKLISFLLFIFSSYFLTRQFIQSKSKAILATILGLLVTTQIDFFYSEQVANNFTAWWKDNLEAVSRLHQRPHYDLSEALMLIAVAMYIKSVRTKSWIFGLISAFSAAFATLMVPFTVLPFLFIVSADIFITFLKSYSGTNWLYHTTRSVGQFMLCIPSITVIVLMRQVALSDPVWIEYKDWEVTFWNRDWLFIYHYYVSFLLLIPFSLFAIIRNLRNKNHMVLLLAIWVCVPFVLFFVSDLIDMSKARILYSSIQVPLSILTVIGIMNSKWNFFQQHIVRILSILFVVYSVILIGIQAEDVRTRVFNESIGYKPIYVPKQYIEGIQSIKMYVPKDAVVAAGPIMSNLIPGFLPVVTVIGHAGQTLKYTDKLYSLTSFFNGNMSDKDAYQWLVHHRITYVLDDPEMKELRAGPLTYSFLEIVWQNNSMQLYKVKSFSL